VHEGFFYEDREEGKLEQNPFPYHCIEEEFHLTLNLNKDRRCFVCGTENKYSLHLNVEKDGERGVRTEFVALDRYRGWSNYLHGGIISLIFDELLGWLSYYLGYDAMTARFEIRYRKPVALGSRLIFTGILENEAKGLLDIKTLALLEDRTLVADGKGRMMVVNRRE
jgi:acyl-coenzyme A thioesterase PaaI-like protein